MNSMTITTERAEKTAEIIGGVCAEIIRALVKERDNLLADGIHSCGPDCQRSGCVNRKLREQLAAVEKERDELTEQLSDWRGVCTRRSEELADVYQQLAAAQAVIAKKDEALDQAFGWAPIGSTSKRIIGEALALPSDNTALRELLAEQREAVVQKCVALGIFTDGSMFAKEVRTTPLVVDK